MPTKFCQQFRASFCRCIKYITVKEPGHFTIYFHYHFICQLKISYLQITIAAQHFIMVSCNVYYTCTLAEQAYNFFYYLDMTNRKISFVELPAIDDIAIQNKN